MALYNFLAGEAVTGADHDLIEISSSLRGVFANLERNVDRFGNSRGKVVKYSEKNLHKSLLHPENGGVELFSQPVLAKDECEEVFNCELAALFSRDRGLAITASSNIFSIEDLLTASSACCGFLDRFDYLYGYRETQAFGTGFARGYHLVDQEHPLLWPGKKQIGNWASIVRTSRHLDFIRDVFDVNLFSPSRLESLPRKKRMALSTATEHFGKSAHFHSFIRWDLDNQEQPRARSFLIEHKVLGAYADD